MRPTDALIEVSGARTLTLMDWKLPVLRCRVIADRQIAGREPVEHTIRTLRITRRAIIWKSQLL